MNGVVNFLLHDINLKLVGATKHAMENGIAMRVRRGPSGYKLSCEGNTQEGLLTSTTMWS